MNYISSLNSHWESWVYLALHFYTLLPRVPLNRVWSVTVKPLSLVDIIAWSDAPSISTRVGAEWFAIGTSLVNLHP